MGGHIIRGLALALVVVAAQAGLAQALEFVEAGTRAQATGVAVTSLLMIAAAFVLGLGGRPPEFGGFLGRVSGAGPGAKLRSLREAMDPWTPAPWSDVIAAVIVLAAAGLLGYFAGAFSGLFPPRTLDEGGIARAMLSTDVVAGVVYVSLGATLGANARPWTVLSALLGFLFFGALCAGAWQLARHASYEPRVIGGLTAGGVILAALVTGFVVSWVRRRLAFVELVLVALLAAYTLYLTVAVGPESLVRGTSLPTEQILLALALFPTVALVSLMTVGGSLGFLLHGGGLFDPGFRIETSVALRYLKAHGRDGFVGTVTIIAVLGVCLGVMALIIVLSIMSGFENDLKTKILGAHAHVVVNKHGDDFSEYQSVGEQVHEVDGVRSAAAFVMGDAMISTDAGLSGTLVKGVDVDDADGTAELRSIVEQGDFDYLVHPEKIPGARPRVAFPPPPVKTTTAGEGLPYELTQPAAREPASKRRVLPGVLIGKELSRTLRAYVGDTVKLVSPESEEIGPLGPTPKLRRFRVAGVFYSGMYEYDAKFTYISMKQAQRFFGMRGRVTGVEIMVEDIDETARVGEELKRRLGGYPYTVKDWRSMNKELFSALLLEKIAMFVALGMIVMVASFLIIAVLVMIVLQRKKEIAVLKSLGASDASIMKIFVLQGSILGIGGALLGGSVGVLVCLFLEKFGVGLDPNVFYIDRLPVVMDWGEIAVIAVSAVVMSYLATIYPAMTAALHPPVEGLRDD